MDSLAYWITLAIYSLLLIAVLIIFLHFAIKTHKLDMSCTIRGFALVIGIIILFTISFELWTIVFDISLSSQFRSKPYCFAQAYIRCISFILFECVLFVFWVIRLQLTFYGSILALPNAFIYAMFILLPSLTLVLMVLLAVSLASIDFNNKCTISDHTSMVTFFLCGQLFAFIFNAFFGYLFYLKLTKFVDVICSQSSKHFANSYSEQRQDAISVLMQKHTLLALITVCSTLIAYTMFDIFLYAMDAQWQYAFLFIDVDMVVKLTTCLLMFKLYEYKFFKICGCCIRIAAMPCYMCCKSHKEEDYISVFKPLAQKAKGFETKDDYDDVFGEDRLILSDKEEDATHEDDEVLTVGKYIFYGLLVKAQMQENKMRQKIFEYSMRNERIEEEMINQINKESEAMGQLKENLFYYRNNDCQYSFIVAMKLEVESVKDANIVTRYVSKRIQDALDQIDHLNGFDYESLLEEIVKDVRTNNMDLKGVTLHTDNNQLQNKSLKSKNRMIHLAELKDSLHSHSVESNA
eukprot:108734_1